MTVALRCLPGVLYSLPSFDTRMLRFCAAHSGEMESCCSRSRLDDVRDCEAARQQMSLMVS